MNKRTLFKLIDAAILFIATVIFFFLDKAAIYPSTMVGFFLVLALIANEGLTKTPSVKAAQYSIIIFSDLVMSLNFFVTTFLPMISSSTDLSSYSVEMTTSLGTADPAVISDHFVEVTINDMHELCYTTTLLLAIYIIFLVVYRIRAKKNEMEQACMKKF